MLEKEPLFDLTPKRESKKWEGNKYEKKGKEGGEARRKGKKDDRREDGRGSSSQKIASLTQRR